MHILCISCIVLHSIHFFAFIFFIQNNFWTHSALGHSELLNPSCQCPHTNRLSLSRVYNLLRIMFPNMVESCGPTSVRASTLFAHDLHSKHSVDAEITDWRGSHTRQSGDDRPSLTHLCWWDLQFHQNSPCACLTQFCKDLYQGFHMQALFAEGLYVSSIQMNIWYALVLFNVVVMTFVGSLT